MRHLSALVAALAVLCIATPALAAHRHATAAIQAEDHAGHVGSAKPKPEKPPQEKAPKLSHQKADWDHRGRDYVLGYDRANGQHVTSYLRATPKQEKAPEQAPPRTTASSDTPSS